MVWMGGVSGNKMQPGIADFGIYKHAFFTDLSTLEKDTTEYNLASDIMSKQKPYTMVMGWHSYAKDKERDFVKLASHYALRVEVHLIPGAVRVPLRIEYRAHPFLLIGLESELPSRSCAEYRNHGDSQPRPAGKAAEP
ncbi:MAG: GxGYxYP family putative glycoside hydrolase [Acidobacteriota bacterium]